MNIRENLEELRREIPSRVKLIAVSKMQSLQHILEAYASGQRRFGENKAQDLCSKHPLLPADIEWHFIGHLQTNKVKYIAPFVHVIQSIDSLKLLCEIDKEALRNNRIIECMLQIYIATEETKFGLDFTEAGNLLSSEEFRKMKHVKIIGLMGMATNTPDVARIQTEFKTLKFYFDNLAKKYFPKDPDFREISLGMSGDYRIAIEQGSTMVRIGSAIFSNKL
jgi:pyridoxal phosphate enzyme (YggS family)